MPRTLERASFFVPRTCFSSFDPEAQPLNPCPARPAGVGMGATLRQATPKRFRSKWLAGFARCPSPRHGRIAAEVAARAPRDPLAVKRGKARDNLLVVPPAEATPWAAPQASPACARPASAESILLRYNGRTVTVGPRPSSAALG